MRTKLNQYLSHWDEYINCSKPMLVEFILKPRRPVQWYFPCLKIKMDENQPLDWLVYDWATNQTSVKTKKNQHSAAREGIIWKHNGQEEATKHRVNMTTPWERGGNQAQGSKKKLVVSTIFRQDSILHKFLCMHNTVACTLFA